MRWRPRAFGAPAQGEDFSHLLDVPFGRRQIDAGPVAAFKYPTVDDVGRDAHHTDLACDGQIVQVPFSRLGRAERFSSGFLTRPERTGRSLTDYGDCHSRRPFAP